MAERRTGRRPGAGCRTGAAPARGEQGAHRPGHDRATPHAARRPGCTAGRAARAGDAEPACWPTATQGGAGPPRSGSRSGAPRASRAPAGHEQRRPRRRQRRTRRGATTGPANEASAFVLANSTLRPVPLAPEIRLHLADDAFRCLGGDRGRRPSRPREPSYRRRSGRSPGLAARRWPGTSSTIPTWWPGASVLDLGAGSGIAGIAAALAGATTVLASDLDPFAAAAIALNAAANHVLRRRHRRRARRSGRGRGRDPGRRRLVRARTRRSRARACCAGLATGTPPYWSATSAGPSCPGRCCAS